MADGVSRLFDGWARDGRAERMGAEHSRTALRFLGSLRLGPRFSFLDVGCGGGWAVRWAASRPGCRRAVGIDKSPGMVRAARAAARSPLERYEVSGIEGFGGRAFDCAFAMESIYYAESVPRALAAVFSALRPGGSFHCGTDFYAENRATARWAREMPVGMHLLPRAGWLRAFREAGFEARSRRVRLPSDRRAWRREHGTLFISGERPPRA